ncbi:MAG TPA: VWA domain-containing protein [Verrucomicrobiae bacterium]|nr:VWA domain-containing protein [Verrucomicrobiae bacterium]
MKCWPIPEKNAKKQVRLKIIARIGFLVILSLVFSNLLSNRVSAQDVTIRSQTNVVLIPALVKDAQGEVVYGLSAADFVVEDDGVPQTVHLDEVPEAQPVSLVIAIQTGRRAAYEFPRIQGLKTMIDPLFTPGTVRVAIVEFDGHVRLARNFTRDESLIADDLDGLQPGDGGAATLDAIAYSVNLLNQEPPERERLLLLISETRDHGSHAKVDKVVSAIGQSNAVMYALAFSPGRSNVLDTFRGVNQDEMNASPDLLAPLIMTVQAMRKNVPSTVASMTGGEYQLFTTRKKFEFHMNDFDNHLHSRYMLSITPKNPHPGLHQLRVHLADPAKRTVLARSSYWAESSK